MSDKKLLKPQAESAETEVKSCHHEGIAIAQNLINRRRFAVLFAGLLAAVSLPGCDKPTLKEAIDHYANGEVQVKLNDDQEDDKAGSEQDKSKEKDSDKAKKTCNGKCEIIPPKPEMELTDIQKEIRKKHPEYVYDQWSRNLVLPGRKKYHSIEEPLVKFEGLYATKTKVNGKTKYIFETDAAVMKKTVAEAFLRAEKKYGKRIVLNRTFATNDTQHKIYVARKKQDPNYRVGEAGRSAHEIGQAVDVYDYIHVRDFLLAEGFLDLECADAPHFEYRKGKRYSDSDRSCSKHNKRYYYTKKAWKRSLGKGFYRVKRFGKKIGKGIKRGWRWLKHKF